MNRPFSSLDRAKMDAVLRDVFGYFHDLARFLKVELDQEIEHILVTQDRNLTHLLDELIDWAQRPPASVHQLFQAIRRWRPANAAAVVHHAGDPAPVPAYNQGIPIVALPSHLQQALVSREWEPWQEEALLHLLSPD